MSKKFNFIFRKCFPINIQFFSSLVFIKLLILFNIFISEMFVNVIMCLFLSKNFRLSWSNLKLISVSSIFSESSEANVWFMSYLKCSNCHQILKLLLNFGCLIIFAIWMGQIQSKLIYTFVTYGLASM